MIAFLYSYACTALCDHFLHRIGSRLKMLPRYPPFFSIIFINPHLFWENSSPCVFISSCAVTSEQATGAEMNDGGGRRGNRAFGFAYRHPVCREIVLHPNCGVLSPARETNCGLHSAFNAVFKRRKRASAPMDGEVKSWKEKCTHAANAAAFLPLGSLLY